MLKNIVLLILISVLDLHAVTIINNSARTLILTHFASCAENGNKEKRVDLKKVIFLEPQKYTIEPHITSFIAVAKNGGFEIFKNVNNKSTIYLAEKKSSTSVFQEMFELPTLYQ